MGQTKIFRPTSSRYLALAIWAILALGVGSAIFGGPPAQAWRLVAPLGLIALVAWLFLWRPVLEVTDGGLQIINPLRTVHIPWPAFADAHVHGTVIVTTTADKSFSVYAAPINNKRSKEGIAADALAEISDRRGQLSAAGYLDNIRPEGAPVTQATATLMTVAIAVLGVASIANWVI